MSTLSLREAAEQAGVSKSTIFRAIKAGRLSAPRNDDGGFAIDPAELHRVYPLRPTGEVARDVAGQGETRPAGHDAPAAGTADATELRIRNAQLEAEINALRTILEVEKERVQRERERSDELKAERDRWACVAEASQRQLTHITAAPAHQPRGWWPFHRAG